MPRKPRYEKTREMLRRRILTKHSVGQKIPSTLHLHKELGVSPQTVNRALADLAGEGLVVRKPRRGTFVARPGGTKTRDIGFVRPKPFENPNPDDPTWECNDPPYLTVALHGAESEANRLNRHILVAPEIDPLKPTFAENQGKIAGVIILFNRLPQTIDAYHKRGIPVVLIDPFIRTHGVPFVTCDNYSAIRDCMLHLIDCGHKRIVHVTVEYDVVCLTLEEREMAYRTVMREAGLEEFTFVHRVHFGLRGAVTDAEFFNMLKETKATACCCCNDLAAAGVTRICHSQGMHVPDDMSVVGIDRVGMSEHFSPPLTTTRTPLEEYGRVAVRILDELIEADEISGDGVVLPAPLVVRASTKPLSTSFSLT